MSELTVRQERFCRAFVEVASAGYAARLAGYSIPTARQQGHRLLKDPRIAQRIADIQAALARDSCRTTEVLLGKLENVYRLAVESRNFHAAARAVEIQARLSANRVLAEAADGNSRKAENAEAVDEC